MYESEERVQQQQLTQRDLIVPRSADSQSGVMVNTRRCRAAKANSEVQARARAVWTANRDRRVVILLRLTLRLRLESE